MKILHIINTLATGGAQSVLAQLLEGWANSGDQQMVISLRSREQLSGRIEALNIPVEHINLQPEKFHISRFIRLIRIIKTYQPDIVQTWLYHADLIGGVSVRFACRAPIVWGVHHTTIDSSSVKPTTWIIIRILSLFSKFLPAHIICCSQSAYQTHLDLDYPGHKMTVITNGVNTDRFRPDPSARNLMRDELGLSSRTKLIGMFARYHPQKDHGTLISAAGILLRRNPDVHFILAGDNIDASNHELQDKISREDIQDNMHLLGGRQDMPKLNAGMDVVTLSSSFGEAMSMSLCEAMASGTPCVATNVGDTAALIGATGLVVEPKNPQALADAWQKILELQTVEYDVLACHARQRILEFYNQVNMVNQYKSIYQGVIRSQPTPPHSR